MKITTFSLVNISFFLWTFISVSTVINAQNTSIPDSNFEQALINSGYDTAPIDGMVPTANINTITQLNVTGKSIADLTGIEDFAALQFLTVTNNNLTTLNLSSNTVLIAMSCDDNSLTSLTLPNTNSFQGLFCSNNQLTSLDVSAYPNLTNLECDNNLLTGELDLSNNLQLEIINCNENQLTSLNLDQQVNTNLKELYCSINEINQLNVTNFPELTQLFFLDNNISSIDVTQNTKLIQLGSGKNPLGSLDVSQNVDLENLGCYENQLTELDISNNNKLQRLSCYINEITSLDLSNKPDLIHLWAHVNNLQELDLSNNPNLERLQSGANDLTYLNVKNGNNTIITQFNAAPNPNLTCIIVDDKDYSATNWTDIDANSTFVESDAKCQALAVEDFKIDGFMIYPNPFVNQITISGKNMIVNEVDIYDYSGKKVRSIQWKGKSTNLEGLPSGLYILKIKTDKGTTARKMLKI